MPDIAPELKRRGMRRNPVVEARLKRAEELIVSGELPSEVTRVLATMGVSERQARRYKRGAYLRLGMYDTTLGEREQHRRQLIGMAYETYRIAKARTRPVVVPRPGGGADYVTHPDADASAMDKSLRSIAMLTSIDKPAPNPPPGTGASMSHDQRVEAATAALRAHYGLGVDSYPVQPIDATPAYRRPLMLTASNQTSAPLEGVSNSNEE